MNDKEIKKLRQKLEKEIKEFKETFEDDTPMTREEIYDYVCEALTSYEHRNDPDVTWYMDDKDWIRNFYCLLTRVRDNWEMITTTDKEDKIE